MKVLPEIQVLKKGEVQNNDGTVLPSFQVEVIAGEESDPSNLDFEWDTTAMDSQSLNLQLTFKTAMYVSAYESLEVLRVTFRDRSLFISESGIAISSLYTPNDSRRRNLQSVDEHGDE